MCLEFEVILSFSMRKVKSQSKPKNQISMRRQPLVRNGTVVRMENRKLARLSLGDRNINIPASSSDQPLKLKRSKQNNISLWCWRRLLRAPWTARRSNHSILKEISPEYSLEGLMLKLKLQYFGHEMRRTDSLKKTLMLGKIEGKRRRG